MRILPLIAALVAAAPVMAGPIGVYEAEPTVTLLDGWSQPDGSRVAGVEIRLAKGWHTYWRVPGDSGIPPEFDWSGSRNVAAVAYEWPRPMVFEDFGLRTFGYQDSMVLPVRLTPKDPAAPMEVSLNLFYGYCLDICRSGDARVETRLAPAAPAAGRAPIEAAITQRAVTAGEAGVDRVTCALAPSGDAYTLTTEITFNAAPGPNQIAIFEPGQPGLWIGRTDTRASGRVITARAPVRAAAAPVLDRSALRVTLLDGHRAIDIRGCEAPTPG